MPAVQAPLRYMSPQLAPNRHANRVAGCPVLEQDRKTFARSEPYRL
jgi:hypothetical protein